MNSLLHRIAAIFAWLGGVAACIVAGMTVTSIAMRALVSAPVQGDVELTQFGIALSISLCLPWCQQNKANIIVDFFTQGLSRHKIRWLDAAGRLLLASMCLLLAWRTGIGAVAVREASETSMILGLPMWWVYVSLAPGLALTAVIALSQAVDMIRDDAAKAGGA